jgi:hypothetical protein
MRLIIKKTYTCFFFSLALLSLLDPSLAFVQQFNITDQLQNWLPRSAALFIFGLFTYRALVPRANSSARAVASEAISHGRVTVNSPKMKSAADLGSQFCS